MDLPDGYGDLTRRLRKVAGQVLGIEQMLDAKPGCRDVVAQLSAANKALEQAGFLLVAAGLDVVPRGWWTRRRATTSPTSRMFELA